VSLSALAERLDPSARWDDLVLPHAASAALQSMLAAVRLRGQVLGDWGFDGFRAGPGVSALFAGPSGTGKTMAAGVLAAELGLDLYRVDVSAVMSKFIGETEKNLAALFEGADRSGTVLFFDEADALFGRRSEVRDSHDRYANLEVSYLLQRMDTYRGVAVLASNLPTALDAAFVRRLRFVVRFPYPDAAGRAELWRRAFPTHTPTEGLDPQRLASLHVSGGVIRGIALAAALLAAQRDESVRMAHVLAAAQQECAKLERAISAEEIDGWT
jgi:SpoVK/Ycf46/Vps4 family AAA+-type ATPase